MGVRLILSDIDRTILPWGDKRVSERTVRAFHLAQEAGIACGVASGRGVEWIPPFFAGDEVCIRTCVATNGNQVFLDGRKLRQADMSALLAPVVDVVRGCAHAGLLRFEGSTPVLAEGRIEDLTASYPAYAAVCERAGDGGALGLLDRLVGKANVFLACEGKDGALAPAPLEDTSALAERLGREVPGLDFDVPQPGFLNVMPAGWNKASGVELLARELGIGLDEVVVFGDAGNDLSMFELVENSVAVANATPEAARAARWHIGPCEEDSVADAIEALAREEWPFNE
ncbi:MULTISPECIES: HAD family hydrolase [Atopobiaceae]|uniref:HAD family phosphatase n=1 Tax=Parafannyhessea umbonata TaxID=604330 RepID=A0A1H6HPP7_9ACTN|nr:MULTISPECIES: HAD family hydrolase [Atopobiaceae]SEH37870.1 hypothetical protein SAMN05216447_101199 [Parafannyhessea umbonata]SJZ40447.1 hypothetical protein SAMN06298223_0214 [Olsenella sp. KH1P3]